MLMRLLKDVSKGSSQPAPTYIISFLKFSALSLNDNRTKYLCNNNASVHILQAKCLPDSIIILLVIISGISYPILIYPRLFVHSLSFLATHSGNNHCISFIAGPTYMATSNCRVAASEKPRRGWPSSPKPRNWASAKILTHCNSLKRMSSTMPSPEWEVTVLPVYYVTLFTWIQRTA